MPGVYNILVEDINGCSSTTVVSIGTGSPLVVMIDSVKFPSCFGFSDGEAYPIVMNGTAPILIIGRMEAPMIRFEE